MNYFKWLYIVVVLGIPLIPISALWLWLNPIGFFQCLLMFIVSVFCYVFIAIAWTIFIFWIVD